jgi:hypothetical protein
MRQTLLVVAILTLITSSVSRANALVVINEFCPNCDPEWVELYNDSEISIDLSGWEIQDGNTKSTDDLTISGEIPAQGMAVYEHPKGWLNDSSDTINLYDNTNNPSPIDSYSYTSTEADKAYSRIPDGFGDFVITDPTKGGFNQPEITAEPTATISSSPTLSPTQVIATSPTQTITTSPTPTVYKTNPVIVATPTRIFSTPLTTKPDNQVNPSSTLSTASSFSAPEGSKHTIYPDLVLGESTHPKLASSASEPSQSGLKIPIIITSSGLLILISLFSYVLYSRNFKS